MTLQHVYLIRFYITLHTAARPISSYNTISYVTLDEEQVGIAAEASFYIALGDGTGQVHEN